MRQLKESVQSKYANNITVDSTLDERYGDKPLFPQKIERVKTLLKGTKFDKSAKADSSLGQA